MNVKKDILWRLILILAITLACLWSMYPLDQRIKLGLDLRGGSHLVLEVQTGDALRADRNDSHDFVVEKLKKEGIAVTDSQFPEDAQFTISVAQAQIRDARKIAEDNLPGWSVDATGTILKARMGPNTQRDREDLAVRQALETIRNRVDALG